MTALIDPALARLSASHMISSSIKWSFTGGEVDWMMNTSRPRTFSPISTWISPSEKRVTSALESGRFKYSQIRRASAGLEFPANTLKSWVNMADQLRAAKGYLLTPPRSSPPPHAATKRRRDSFGAHIRAESPFPFGLG